MKKLRGNKQAMALQEAILELIGDFDEELVEAGLSGRVIDAHVAAILINLLYLIVHERETFSGAELAGVIKRELRQLKVHNNGR